MILTDEVEDTTTTKAQQARTEQLQAEAETGEGGSSTVLPDVPPPYTPHIPDTSHLLPKHHRKHRRRVNKRFVKAMFFSCFIILLAWAFSASLFLVLSMSRSKGSQDRHSPRITPSELGQCISVSEWNGIIMPFPGDGRYYSNLAFNIPTESAGLVIRSPPKLANGQVEIASPRNYLGPTIKLEVRAAHRSLDVLDHLYACDNQLSDKRHVHTLYIAPFADANTPQEDIFLDVSVYLPSKSFYGNVTHFNSIETNMPYFKHVIRKLTEHEYVHYGSASFVTRESPVIVEGLSADKVFIKADHSTIDAVINATSSVQLHAPDGKISAMLNITREVHHNSTVMMTSTQGTMKSTIRFHETTSVLGTRGAFKLLTRGSQAGTDITVVELSSSSTLLLDAFVARGPLKVSLPTTFEGAFAVRSDHTQLQVRRRVPDPLGYNRTRQVEWSHVVSGRPTGTVRWIPQERNLLGNVTLLAPGGSAVLAF